MEQDPANPLESAPMAEARLRALIGENRFQDAMAFAASARSAFPADPTLAGLQAYLCLRLGRGEQAIGAAVEALALGAADAITMLVLGLAYRSRGRHAEAAETLLDGHRRFPDQVNIAGVRIEEMAEAHGVEATRPVFDEVFARLPDRDVAMIWAKALFAAEVDDGMPPGIASAPVMPSPPGSTRQDRRRPGSASGRSCGWRTRRCSSTLPRIGSGSMRRATSPMRPPCVGRRSSRTRT